ncbi:MAG: TonB-dependent receptor [Burkholderiales bacterium]|nr:TonB-dependent receptor [Burkholderiales bacterium]
MLDRKAHCRAATLLLALFAVQDHAADDDAIRVQGGKRDYDERQYDTADKLVIRHDELLRDGDTELTDALKRLPGITVGSAGEVSLRGLASGYTQVQVNGDRMPQGFSLDSLPPDMVDHVEITRTARADSTGQAIAGTINIVLKRRARTAQRALTATMTGAEGLAQPSLGMHLSDRKAAWSWTLDGSAGYKDVQHHIEEIDVGSDAQRTPILLRVRQTIDPIQTGSLSLAPTLQMTPSDLGTIGVESFLKADHIASNLSTVSRTPLGQDDLHGYDVQRNRHNLLVTRTDLSWAPPMNNDGKLELKLALNTAQRNTVFREQGDDYMGTPNLDTVVFSHAAEQGLAWSGKYTLAPLGDHTMAAGWYASISHRAETRDEYARGFPGIAPIDTADIYQSQMHSYALYWQDAWQASERLSLYGGLRWEWLQTHSTGDTFATVDEAISTPCPTLQGVWKLSDTGRDQIRLALARSYNAPAIAKLVPRVYTSTNNSAVEPDFQGNPQLRPEIGFGPDIAYEAFPADGVSLSVGAYARRIENYVRQDISQINRRWLIQPINAGDAHTHGVEMDFKLPVRLLLPTQASWVLSGNVTRNWSRVDQVPGPANRIARQTPWSGSLAADYTATSGRYAAGASYSYTAGGLVRTSPTLFADSARRDELSLYGLWKPKQGMQLKLSASNLLHQRWVDVAGYMDATGTLSATRIEPSHMALRIALDLAY